MTQSHFLKKTQTQQGAALIVCLMFLMIMTIIGISSITSSTMEEKMAGNIRNKHLSFQAAETALREGEIWADSITAATAIDASGGYYSRSYANDPIWEQSGTTWLAAVNAGSVVGQEPEYIVEDFGESPRDQNCILELPIPAGCLLPMYRVTARGTGINANTVSTVQSTYKSP